MAQRLLARSAQLFFEMMADRRTRAAARPADPHAVNVALTEIEARLVQPSPLPSLTSALSARRAIFGAHEVAA